MVVADLTLDEIEAEIASATTELIDIRNKIATYERRVKDARDEEESMMTLFRILKAKQKEIRDSYGPGCAGS